MSDRDPASIRVYKVAGHEAAIADLLDKWGFAKGDGGERPVAGDIRDGAWFFAADANFGVLGEVSEALEVLDVTYRIGLESHEATVRIYTTELGTAQFAGDQSGEIVVSDAVVNDLLDALDAYLAEPSEASAATLRAKAAMAEQRSGREWTRALAAT